MIVFISWVSFWLPINAVPARIALGSTTVLIMITQRQSTAISLPPVSYVKAIDVWTVTCLVFVFAALLEYAVVSTYSRHETKRLSIKVIQNNKTLKQTINVNRVSSIFFSFNSSLFFLNNKITLNVTEWQLKCKDIKNENVLQRYNKAKIQTKTQ